MGLDPPLVADEAARPAVDDAVGVVMLALDRADQVGHVLRRISERIAPGVGLERDVVDRRRVVVEPRMGGDPQVRRGALEAGDGDGIAEHVVEPTQLGRSGVDVDPRVEQLLIIALARPDHQPVLAERHRLAIGVGRDMRDRQGRASGFRKCSQQTNPNRPRSSTRKALRRSC